MRQPGPNPSLDVNWSERGGITQGVTNDWLGAFACREASDQGRGDVELRPRGRCATVSWWGAASAVRARTECDVA
jgi:hypothetical protein